MSITILCERATVNTNAQQTVTAVVSVKAPSSEDANDRKDSAPRGGVDIVAVMDVSGSMQGPKITTLRQTLLAAIDLLGPADRLSLIAFESRATRLIPLTRMTDAGRRTAREAVVRLNAGGGTDIGAALETAAAVVEGRRSRNPVCGVLLLTDGQDGDAFSAHPPLVARARAAGATVSTFGYGRDHDARLLETIAEAGRGQFSYVERVDLVREMFGRCLGSLFSVAAQAVRLDLRPRAGAAIAHVAADGAQAPLEGGGMRVDLGELFRDESRDLLVELVLPPSGGGGGSGGDVCLEGEVTWALPGGGASLGPLPADAAGCVPGRVARRRPSPSRRHAACGTQADRADGRAGRRAVWLLCCSGCPAPAN